MQEHDDPTQKLKPMPQILIVEDEPAIAELFRTLFRMEGMDAEVASSNAEAIEQLQLRRPDLILLDVMMPHESGLDLCRFVRGACQFADIPVIIVSASAQERDVEAGTEAGADVNLKKPIPNEELLRGVRGHTYPSKNGPCPPGRRWQTWKPL